MRSAAEKLRFFHRSSSLSFLSPRSAFRQFKTSTSTTTTTAAAAANTSPALTEEEVNQINAVIGRLCDSNHLKEASDLISAALSTARPPLASLPLSSLISRLASEPDLTHPMHLLNTLKYNPNASDPSVLIPVAKMLLSSLFQNGRPKMAVKVFQWVARPDFPGGPAADLDLYGVLVNGFCRNGMMLESLRVLRVMAGENLVIGDEIRVCIHRGLLREARVREALELNAALGSYTPGSDGSTCVPEKVVHLLDQMIANWVE
ncbi:uncharacterized protein LOC130987960 isoform X1 [Salvia miltiorrhiza]|uniref:uncharacterized protein LOC130987960 isoform X1 n=1 Tax=Salvia miltiorrhiza TaxID=226208 RepID=UPI0025AD6065|nr:uncharacterized protein LOC130987960 isoform X1 [Salvia miltiorrhiza]XP_057767665.1 uncharacterized protein LOC130987960 isoform X1 [Salvia miltiorrhiza]